MPETGYIAVFLIGLLGGTHCVAMCGGIVGALSVQTAPMPGKARRQWPLHLAYNLGRITTYTALGTVVGGIGSAGLLFDDLLPVQLTLYVAANIMLVLLGLYLTGMTRLLAPIERAGGVLWRRIQPLTARFLPARTVGRALPLGLLWGFLPCGLVYSVLTASLMTGSAVRGGTLMLVFGLGTLPNLMLAGMLFKRFRDFTHNTRVRFIAGMIVMGFGLFGLYHAPSLGGHLWQGICVA
ncbi:MAG TPA: sulfite exporter TauE/SafE family protein [Azoarcus sp.]|nr:sulfite exporter TauE/SafE family protein [Azoarcus sp.]